MHVLESVSRNVSIQGGVLRTMIFERCENEVYRAKLDGRKTMIIAKSSHHDNGWVARLTEDGGHPPYAIGLSAKDAFEFGVEKLWGIKETAKKVIVATVETEVPAVLSHTGKTLKVGEKHEFAKLLFRNGEHHYQATNGEQVPSIFFA